jgi:glycosyltransferase involved in cell wall biosynthesis
MSEEGDRPWLFCQLGAREHYVLPRAFHRQGRLRALITDAWVRPGSLAAKAPGALGRRFADRFSTDLADAPVEDLTAATVTYEAAGRLRGRASGGWPAIMARNAWFERQAVGRLKDRRLLEGRPVVFAYSYAALEILRAGREAGCPTVLGQIDPAITEETIVADAVRAHADLSPDWAPAPPAYWARWREECALADRIVVNSAWSRSGLAKAGVDPAKLVVAPLAYEGEVAAAPHDEPGRFTDQRPLRVLFLGTLNIRKGVAELLEAAGRLADAPVEFHLVGPEAISCPPDAIANPKVFRHGPIPRGEVAAYFAAADVFILPSLSDGFGLTQLEAQAHGLPVIASRRCGDVVRDGIDGLLLDEVSGPAVAKALRRYLNEPGLVAEHGRQALANLDRFTAPRIAARLDQALRGVEGGKAG